MKIGDRVIWRFTLPDRKELPVPVPGIIRKVGAHRVTVEVAYKINGQWVREYKSIPPGKLSPRHWHEPQLDQAA